MTEALSQPFKQVYLNAQAYIVEYETAQQVLDEQPDLAVLKRLGKIRTAITAPGSITDVAITGTSNELSLVFHVSSAPGNGIDEDP